MNCFFITNKIQTEEKAAVAGKKYGKMCPIRLQIRLNFVKRSHESHENISNMKNVILSFYHHLHHLFDPLGVIQICFY